MMEIKLATTDYQFNELHKKIDGLKKGSTEVKVSKEALWNLLQDHTLLYSAATRNKNDVTTKEE